MDQEEHWQDRQFIEARLREAVGEAAVKPTIDELVRAYEALCQEFRALLERLKKLPD